MLSFKDDSILQPGMTSIGAQRETRVSNPGWWKRTGIVQDPEIHRHFSQAWSHQTSKLWYIICHLIDLFFSKIPLVVVISALVFFILKNIIFLLFISWVAFFLFFIFPKISLYNQIFHFREIFLRPNAFKVLL